MIQTPAGPSDGSPSMPNAVEPSSPGDLSRDSYDEFSLDYHSSANGGTSFSDLDFPLG